MVVWLLLSLFSIFSSWSAPVVEAESRFCVQDYAHEAYWPDNTVIVFDWHEVIQEQNFKRIFTRILKRNKRYMMSVINPYVWLDIKIELGQKKVLENIMLDLEARYPNLANIEQALIDSMNEEPFIDDTISLIDELKLAGYSIYLLSNMAPQTLEQLKVKHPHVLDKFDGYYTPNVETQFIKKPDVQFYASFKRFLADSGQPHKKIVFIDDKEKNISGAQAEGYCGIVFRSANQLRDDLKNLKVIEITP